MNTKITEYIEFRSCNLTAMPVDIIICFSRQAEIATRISIDYPYNVGIISLFAGINIDLFR